MHGIREGENYDIEIGSNRDIEMIFGRIIMLNVGWRWFFLLFSPFLMGFRMKDRFGINQFGE